MKVSVTRESEDRGATKQRVTYTAQGGKPISIIFFRMNAREYTDKERTERVSKFPSVEYNPDTIN